MYTSGKDTSDPNDGMTTESYMEKIKKKGRFCFCALTVVVFAALLHVLLYDFSCRKCPIYFQFIIHMFSDISLMIGSPLVLRDGFLFCIQKAQSVPRTQLYPSSPCIERSICSSHYLIILMSLKKSASLLIILFSAIILCSTLKCNNFITSISYSCRSSGLHSVSWFQCQLRKPDELRNKNQQRLQHFII